MKKSKADIRGVRFPRSRRQGRSGLWSCPWRSCRRLRPRVGQVSKFSISCQRLACASNLFSLFSPPRPPSCLPVPGRKYTKPMLLLSRWPRYGLADALPMAMRPLIAADRLTGLTAVMTHPLLSVGPGCMSGWGGLVASRGNSLGMTTSLKSNALGFGDSPWLDEASI